MCTYNIDSVFLAEELNCDLCRGEGVIKDDYNLDFITCPRCNGKKKILYKVGEDYITNYNDLVEDFYSKHCLNKRYFAGDKITLVYKDNTYLKNIVLVRIDPKKLALLNTRTNALIYQNNEQIPWYINCQATKQQILEVSGAEDLLEEK